MVDIKAELLRIARNYCEACGITCKRFAKSQIEIAQYGTRGGYDCVIAYYNNKAAGIKLYIDYDVMRGTDNEVLAF